MRKTALTLAAGLLAVSAAGIGAAFAQTAAPAAPDATMSEPAAKAAAPKKHQKVAMNKQKAKTPKKAGTKHQAAPATDESTTE